LMNRKENNSKKHFRYIFFRPLKKKQKIHL